ncbi:MBL fold metallo-hydrolase, partial [Chloroflexota bacterium]
MILKKLEVGPLASNCYVAASESSKAGMIIDPGDEAEVILKKVKELELDIKSIVLTHTHIDHIGALKDVKEATGAEVAIHNNDAQNLQKNSVNTMFGLSYPTPLPPDRLLKDGDSIDIDTLHFLVLHTPGHSPGGICLLGQGIVFSGDTLFNYGIGRADLP